MIIQPSKFIELANRSQQIQECTEVIVPEEHHEIVLAEFEPDYLTPMPSPKFTRTEHLWMKAEAEAQKLASQEATIQTQTKVDKADEKIKEAGIDTKTEANHVKVGMVINAEGKAKETVSKVANIDPKTNAMKVKARLEKEAREKTKAVDTRSSLASWYE